MVRTAFCPSIGILVVVLALAGTGGAAEDGAGDKILINTNMGNITIQLYDDMPVTAGNFEKLVAEGFYNDTPIHRVARGFVIQGGDPTGTGFGGPGYTIKDEFTDHNRNYKGTVAMANTGPDTGGSQFFINLDDNLFLDSLHPVFGVVVDGMDVVEKIGMMEADDKERPYQDVVVVSALVIS